MAKYFVFGGLALLSSGVAFVGYQAFSFEPRIAPDTIVGPVRVGGMSREQAARQIRVWWDAERQHRIQLTSPLIPTGLPAVTPTELGVTVDDAASVEDLPEQSFAASWMNKVNHSQDETNRPIVYKTIPVDFSSLSKTVHRLSPKPAPATARYEDGQIVVHKESTSYKLDADRLPQAALTAVQQGAEELETPIEEAPKHVPDEALNDIKEVVSSYATDFASSNVPRSTNIRLASGKLNGVVLMPGDVISFNQTVGERTVDGGYQVAGVLKNGKHDTGLGGGICQVSGTLYNALLLGDLKIIHRENHSIPVPYLAVGRDATVDYGDLDLVFQNDTDKAIAISSVWEPGTLHFYVLGTKVPGRSVKIETDHYKTWDNGEETRVDPTLPPGSTTIDNPGAIGRSIDTYRLVYEDGKLVRKETMSHSYYSGAKRVILTGPPMVAAPGTPPASVPTGGGTQQ